MYQRKVSAKIYASTIVVVALLVVFGVVGVLRGASVSLGGEPQAHGVGAALDVERDRDRFAPAPVVSETVHLPVVLKAPFAGKWLSVWANEDRAPVMRAISQVSERDYGLHLSVTEVENVHQAIMNAAQFGLGPDLFVAAHDRLGSWLEEGVVVPINLGAKRDDFAEVALSGFTNADQLYGLPYAFENMALFRNLDLVKDAPASWDDLLATGQALKASGHVSYSLALEDNGYKVYPIVTTFGGYVFGRASNGTWITADLGISGTGMISAGNWISASVGAGDIPAVAHDAYTAETLFENGHAPYIMTGPWSLKRFRDANVNYGLSVFPDGGVPFADVHGLMINANSAKQGLAHDFLTEFVATAGIMEMLYQHEERPPAYKPLLGSLNDPDLADFYDAGVGAEPMPAVPEMGCVWGPWDEAVIKIITLAETPEEALTKAAEEIDPCINNEHWGMVNVPGSYQMIVGCAANWDPACLATAMTKTNGLYTSTHALPAGEYEVKVAHDGSWFENYGAGGILDGDNIPFSLTTAGVVTFTYDPSSHLLNININP